MTIIVVPKPWETTITVSPQKHFKPVVFQRQFTSPNVELNFSFLSHCVSEIIQWPLLWYGVTITVSLLLCFVEYFKSYCVVVGTVVDNYSHFWSWNQRSEVVTVIVHTPYFVVFFNNFLILVTFSVVFDFILQSNIGLNILISI